MRNTAGMTPARRGGRADGCALFQQLANKMWFRHTQRDVDWLHQRQGRPGEALSPLTETIDMTARAGDAYSEAMRLSSRP
ncbi:hypothetical protein [Streptomyces sp900116325]|uniref:hypothetical protein n=1 Tax=Streptomyces sp. 900116325 TaxID=3154295 RepID=UPI0033CEFBD1